MRRSFLIITVLSLEAGCASNPYTQFYKAAPNEVLRSVAARRVEPPPATPEILRGNDPKTDIPALAADGWVVIGTSNFNGPKLRDRDAMAQARAIGADRVVLYGRLASTEHTAVPLTLPTTQTSVTNATATAFGPAGTATAYGSAVTTTYGNQTTYVPITNHRYDALAVYMVKERYAFGARYRNLTPDESRRAATVNGALVVVVVRGSPAAAAGILPEDMILRVDGEPVIDIVQLNQVLEERQGKMVTMQIMRGEAKSDVTVTLGSY